jgi:selenocysteine-specific elongation factor
VIALTKVDLVDDDLLELAQMDVADHVNGTFLDGAPVIPVAATAGRGIEEMRVALDDLIERSEGAVDRGRPRLWIDRVFAAKGSGTVATGTLVGGSLRVDENVTIAPGDHSVRIRSIQTAGASVDAIGPGNRVAVNLSGIDHHELSRGDVVVEPDRWHLTDRLDASLDVLESLDHEVSRRGAYVAYIGAGEHPVKMRVLGNEALSPGTTGSIRLFLPSALPLLPGDRYILRESGRDETVGGGEVLDIAPVMRSSRAAPDRSIGRVVRERGWVTVAELERLTGETVEATLGQWVTTPEALADTVSSVIARVEEAGDAGIDVAAFGERERAVLDSIDEVVVDAGLVLPADAIDPYADHPFLSELLAGGFSPPSADGVDRNDIRELARRGHIVANEGLVFHALTIDAAAHIAASLLSEHPDGFTVAQFRDATGASRKFALPLVSELDKRGVTRRREDVRIGGPRLPI